jgi:hypothetical protein
MPPDILIARPDGLTHVPHAIAITTDTLQLLDDILDKLTATTREAPDDSRTIDQTFD